MSKHIKTISKQEFCEIQKRVWNPVKLEGKAIPYFLKGIPENLLHSVYASGGPFPGVDQSKINIGSAHLIGGIDVYRYSTNDPVQYNKDWYPVIAFSDSDNMFLVQGPICDSEHWINEIPKRLANAEILAVPPLILEIK